MAVAKYHISPASPPRFHCDRLLDKFTSVPYFALLSTSFLEFLVGCQQGHPGLPQQPTAATSSSIRFITSFDLGSFVDLRYTSRRAPPKMLGGSLLCEGKGG